MRRRKAYLEKINICLAKYLMKHSDIMPKSFSKMLAWYYPDARIRKKYLEKMNVFMGDGTFANVGLIAVTDGETPVYIGDHVSIAPNCVLVTVSSANNGTSIQDIPYIRDVLTKRAPIIIEDNVWIGANVTILPGITVGHHSVIGAGSVVTKDIDSYSVYAGVPAKKIRTLHEDI